MAEEQQQQQKSLQDEIAKLKAWGKSLVEKLRYHGINHDAPAEEPKAEENKE